MTKEQLLAHLDWFGPKRIGFVKFLADVRNEQNEDDYLPGIVFLRGGSVAILMILQPTGSEHERYVVMVDQARIPAATLSFLEIPAGMLEGNDFKGTAATERKKETGLEIMTSELKNMTDLALHESAISSDLQRAMYLSPGGSVVFLFFSSASSPVSDAELGNLHAPSSSLIVLTSILTFLCKRNEPTRPSPPHRSLCYICAFISSYQDVPIRS
ncbi:Nudix hydrolase 14-like protein [Lachnellula arida]|uniref:Nudix hydrolase 14-like protein n=1 Tax=Lachnellula arida TaxID=1316785 RepID=A0A8T9B5H6_9HELO|nr:Nudix hydrolase 14-like protein [Lachnellula arida]